MFLFKKERSGQAVGVTSWRLCRSIPCASRQRRQDGRVPYQIREDQKHNLRCMKRSGRAWLELITRVQEVATRVGTSVAIRSLVQMAFVRILSREGSEEADELDLL